MVWQLSIRQTPQREMEIDRWVVLAHRAEYGRKWIRQNFEIISDTLSDVFVARPWFDPEDPLELKLVAQENSIYGNIYYDILDIRPQINRVHDEVVGSTFLRRVLQNRRVRDPSRTYAHPRPSNLNEQMEESNRAPLFPGSNLKGLDDEEGEDHLCPMWLRGNRQRRIRDLELPEPGMGAS